MKLFFNEKGNPVYNNMEFFECQSNNYDNNNSNISLNESNNNINSNSHNSNDNENDKLYAKKIFRINNNNNIKSSSESRSNEINTAFEIGEEKANCCNCKSCIIF